MEEKSNVTWKIRSSTYMLYTRRRIYAEEFSSEDYHCLALSPVRSQSFPHDHATPQPLQAPMPCQDFQMNQAAYCGNCIESSGTSYIQPQLRKYTTPTCIALSLGFNNPIAISLLPHWFCDFLSLLFSKNGSHYEQIPCVPGRRNRCKEGRQNCDRAL